MKTIQELGQSVAIRRKSLGLRQKSVAESAGVTPGALSRFERGRVPEFGARKLLAVLAVLGAELRIADVGVAGTLDELAEERAQQQPLQGHHHH